MNGSNDLLHTLGQLLNAFADAGTQPGAASAALRAAARAAQRHGVDVEIADEHLRINGEAHGLADTANEPVLAFMVAHGIRRLTVRRHATARDIAQLAGLLSRNANTVDGHELVSALDELRLWSVRLVAVGQATADAELPPAVETALTTLESARDHAAEQGFFDALLREAGDDAHARARLVARGLVRALPAIPDIATTALGGEGTPLAADAIATILSALEYAMVSSDDDVRGDAMAVFTAAGSTGVQAVITHLAAATTIGERRRCFEALIGIEGAVPTLVEALEHPQWFVVRNVAQVLGEMAAVDAIEALSKTLAHRDARVRVSVAAALDRIGGPLASSALQGVVGDESPEVRRLAARAYVDAPLGSALDGGIPLASRLMAAADRETDSDVMAEQMRALGAVGSPPAVQRLIRVAVNANNPAAQSVRLAALEALVRARGAAALPTLRSLRTDRDPAVRTTARSLETTVAA